MPKPTSLALVLALALATAAGCGNSAREDALEVIDRVETALEEIHTITVQAHEKIITTIPEVRTCNQQPNVEGVILGAWRPFRDPTARQLQDQAHDLWTKCMHQYGPMIQQMRRLLPNGGMETVHEGLQRVRSRIETGPEDGLRRIMEEAESDEARFQRLARFDDPTAEFAIALMGQTQIPNLDVEDARQSVEQETNAILAAYEDYQETADRMSETAGEARRLHEEYLNRQ